MDTLTTWGEYESRASELVKAKRVEEFSHYVLLNAVAEPGVISWSERETKMPEVHDSARKIESAFKMAFSDLEILAVESPKGHNPDKEVERYSATLAVRDNGCVYVGISLDFSYNPKHERTETQGLERFPQVPFDMVGSLSLGKYQQKTVDFLKNVWASIDSFHYCTKEGQEYDGTFILEVKGNQPVSGGQHLLKKLDLSLPKKSIYIPF
ncbi:hypothetical protein A3K73_05875 [Candidatus Pacearchaeota archaeon RBG_13_36_9]|nr:MAG: hypothetical protein A3K73_05875 [Candidatus Pacearchaeota archaeon RBG_13_36_9]